MTDICDPGFEPVDRSNMGYWSQQYGYYEDKGLDWDTIKTRYDSYRMLRFLIGTVVGATVAMECVNMIKRGLEERGSAL